MYKTYQNSSKDAINHLKSLNDIDWSNEIREIVEKTVKEENMERLLAPRGSRETPEEDR